MWNVEQRPCLFTRRKQIECSAIQRKTPRTNNRKKNKKTVQTPYTIRMIAWTAKAVRWNCSACIACNWIRFVVKTTFLCIPTEFSEINKSLYLIHRNSTKVNSTRWRILIIHTRAHESKHKNIRLYKVHRIYY